SGSLKSLRLLTRIDSTNRATRPSTANRPTQISISRELCMALASLIEHQRGQYEVQAQHGQGGMDDGPGRRAADPLRRGHGIIALEQRYPGGDETEDDAFQDSIVHVID